MKNFIYDIPTKVYFGPNQIDNNLSKELKKFGNKVLLVYGGGSIKKTGLYDKIINELKSSNIQIFELSGIEPNPRHTSVNKGAQICKEEDIDVILAVGGGSVIDATKFMAAGRYYEGNTWDFLIGKAKFTKALPIVSILTLSATGSEMDSGGVITNIETKEKLANAHPILRPKVSFLDPTNTYSVSKYQTACGSADILSHIIEVYFYTYDAMYMLDTFMEGLMKTVIKYAPIAINQPDDYEARANLMWTSSWAINGFISQDKSHAWSCHPIEHELSAFYDITHGLGLAILTPRWMKHVLNTNTVDKFYQFGVNVFDIDKNLNKMEVAEKAIEKLESFLFKDLNLSDNLTKLNIDNSHFETMAERITKNGPLKGFVDLNKNDIVEIYNACL